MKNEKLSHFFSGKTGRSIIIVASVLLIGLAVYLNYRLFYDPATAIGYGQNAGGDTQVSAQPSGEADYFTATGLVRSQSRDEAIDVLKTVSASADASESAKADAQAQISKIAADIQNEANIEALVKAKGFENCIAVIGEDSVSVVVKAETLQAAQAAQIFSIVYETTGVSPDRISIINK